MRCGIVVCALAGTASADRAITVNVGGMGVFENRGDYGIQGHGGPRMTAAWEAGPLPYPEPGDAVVAVSVVPELIAGAYFDGSAQSTVGVGVRGQLALAQREQGAAKLTVRGSFYLAARALVVDRARGVHGEAAVGHYFFVGKHLRFGLEGGAVAHRLADSMDADHVNGMVQLYVGWGTH